ncbi:MAG: NADP-specific glutamate dehydrogenase, partial [Bacteriovoracaceae bacterium]|nr:NADP-specific glutamate dehydrogenase [Bacteriovoracaceae bacterium]
MSAYVSRVLDQLQATYPWEKEFLQSVQGVFSSAAVMLDKDPKYEKHKILERLAEPERTISF